MSCLVMFGMSAQAKDYHYQMKGDLMNTRIYTLDNGLKVYLPLTRKTAHSDILPCGPVRATTRLKPLASPTIWSIWCSGTKKFRNLRPCSRSSLPTPSKTDTSNTAISPTRPAPYTTRLIVSLAGGCQIQIHPQTNTTNWWHPSAHPGLTLTPSKRRHLAPEDIPANEVENWGTRAIRPLPEYGHPRIPHRVGGRVRGV